LISAGFTSMNVATMGTQTIDFGSSNTLVFRANTSTERMRITTGGLVGIGTDSPNRQLVLYSSVNPTFQFADPTSTTAAGAGSLLQHTTATGSLVVRTYDANGSIILQTTGAVERMRIANTGNIGIATDAPAQRLHIGLTGANNYIQFGTTNEGFVIGRENATGEFIFDATQASPYNVFKWRQSGTERMRIAADGNVGIGTTGPFYPLSFSGSTNTYQATGTQVGFGNSGFSGYGPHIGTANRTYVHFTGPGGGSSNSTWIHGYQVGNPAGSNWMRVAPGISGNPVTGFTIVDGAVYFYLDNSKTTGNADYSPTLRSGQNQYGYFVGNTLGTSGTGYTFPATQDPSSNANTLDDYEEGSFTPTLGGSSTNPVYTASVAQGVYTKIGRVVHFSILIIVTGVSSQGTGTIFINGLPFSKSADVNSYATPQIIGYNDIWDTAFPSAFIGTNYLIPQPTGVTQAAANWGTTSSSASNLSTGYLGISGTYITS
jgi:hypothetical protein